MTRQTGSETPISQDEASARGLGHPTDFESPEVGQRPLIDDKEGPSRRRLNPLEKAARNPKSKRLAINAMCYDCEGGDADPCIRWRIGNCTRHECPLRPQRPYQHLEGKQTPKALGGPNGMFAEGS